MSESDDELDRIRERKRERLLDREGETNADAAGADAEGETKMPDEPIRVGSEGRFREVIDEHDVVLVDFYADWCGPCKLLEPTIESVAREGPAAVAKVDVDRLGGLAGRYGVQGVPTLLLFAGGEAVERLVGAQDKATLLDLIERYGE